MLFNSMNRLAAVLNHDFCPNVNRWVYWLKHPLATVMLAAIVALFCGLFVNIYGLLLFGVLTLVSGLGVVWPWIAMRGVTAEADFLTSRCRVGGAVSVRLKIRNSWPWPIWGLSLRHGFNNSDDGEQGIALACLGGWSETEFEWVFRPTSRGVYPLKQAELDSGFPFGLIHARTPVDFSNELIVWPASVALDCMPDAAEINSREDRLAERRVGELGDMVGTRPFRNGDSLRRVHWGQTARYGRLIVTERQAPATCAVRLFIETSRSLHTLDGSLNTLELAISVTASILESLHRQHAFVELVVGSETISVGASASDLRTALDALAKIPVGGELGRADRGKFFSRDLSTILVTTHQADYHDVRHLEDRLILIGEPQLNQIQTHAWFELGSQEMFQQEFSERWRRACHAA